MSKPETKNLNLDLIRIDGGTQPRVKIDLDVIDEYAAAFENGDEMPAIDVFFDGAEYWLADGFHRYHGAKKHGMLTFSAKVHAGTLRDAVLFSVGANATHGLKRSNEDKRNAVTKLLKDEEWSKWSARAIADKCGVSHQFVINVRPETVSTVDTVSKVKFLTPTGKVAEHTVKPRLVAADSVSRVVHQDQVDTQAEKLPQQETMVARQEHPETLDETEAPSSASPPVTSPKPFDWPTFRNHVIEFCDKSITKCPDEFKKALSNIFTQMAKDSV